MRRKYRRKSGASIAIGNFRVSERRAHHAEGGVVTGKGVGGGVKGHVVTGERGSKIGRLIYESRDRRKCVSNNVRRNQYSGGRGVMG